MSAEQIVVIGFGPVAARLVEDLLPAVRAHEIELTVLGAETHAAYNRVMVGELGGGRTTLEAITLADPEELTAAGVHLRLGTTVQRVNRSRRTVLLDSGEELAYDRLVFATGARPVLPTLRGLNFAPHVEPELMAGVAALRDVDDAAALRRVLDARGRVVILGGGVLGVEAALLAHEQGGDAVLVHHGPYPLGRSVDADAGRLLAARLRAAGIELISSATAVGLREEAGAFAGLELDDGTIVAGDLLVLSVGVRPRDELAAGCGLTTNGGIHVNRRLCADTEDRVFAIGDCAAVDGERPSGLIGPGWNQASWLAEYLAAHPVRNPFIEGPADASASAEVAAVTELPSEPPGAILLKARGLNLAAGGRVDAGLWDEPGLRVSIWADPDAGAYVKLVTEGGVLTGFVAIGMPKTAAELVMLYERGRELPADRTTLFRLDDPGMAVAAEPAPDDVLCRCSGATHGDVAAARDAGCSSVEAVGASCRAGTGCGGCREKIEAILAAAPEPSPERLVPA
ncbi:FAD-dependent oxidoreductase [Zhihengliuella flava]|uniref:Assimilatory nitrate reductase electron transfer subunit n=1 Tax=Zhihengliuella flava TaxID=1285193 RepID=A0A931DD28_9MICC|nr:FAD-dependent oxidoreductase [Zhihengliuella flava]MBG6084555.1 assimilatory nitrate reductase electron transfer subunit [Zhihengliuella flava]